MKAFTSFLLLLGRLAQASTLPPSSSVDGVSASSHIGIDIFIGNDVKVFNAVSILFLSALDPFPLPFHFYRPLYPLHLLS